MSSRARENPCLRPVEAIPDGDGSRVFLRDPTHLAAGTLVVGRTELLLLALLDGSRTRLEIQSEYARHTGRLLVSAELDGLLDQLDGAGFLEGEGFERYYGSLVGGYLSEAYRPLKDPDGFGVSAAELPSYLDEALLESAKRPDLRREPPAGIVVPHLDFPRGLPCYADGYAPFHERRDAAPLRVVVLGTNHYGRSRSVVATDRDFETPWGVLPTDREFLYRLEAECGGTLRPYELDHLHEHSVELQTVWLHHLFGDRVQVVPFLCPDPTGSRGTRPGDPGAVDLREFALALGHQVREDPTPTLLVASADLSHVGRYFGDELDLDEPFLAAVGELDEAGLRFIDRNDPEGYREHMARTENPTRVCSVGCLYALMVALGPSAEPQRLRYHQAATPEIDNAVTCAAYAFYG